MVNRYPYDTDISITGVGEEECQTAIETFEKQFLTTRFL
mgnify:FL=1